MRVEFRITMVCKILSIGQPPTPHYSTNIKDKNVSQNLYTVRRGKKARMM